MKSPRERYYSDPAFARLVDMIEVMIERADFSPSEIREASMLACINHEMRTVRTLRVEIPNVTECAIGILEKFVEGKIRLTP